MLVCDLGKAALTAPLYISIAWSLIISYQVFTLTAVYSFVRFLSGFWPSVGAFIIPRISMVTFIHAFAWIFVLSSVIPVIILGKSRSVLLQFFLCLTVTLVAVSIEDVLTHMMGTAPTAQMQSLSMWFQNPLVAGLYLSVPYMFMLYLDIRARKKGLAEPGQSELEPRAVATLNADEQQGDPRPQSGGRPTFLYGASVVCFLLSVAIFWFGEAIFSPFLPMGSKLIYTAFFAALGALLLVVGLYSGNLQEQRVAWDDQTVSPLESSRYAAPQGKEHTRTKEPHREYSELPPADETEGVDSQIADLCCEIQIGRYDVLHPDSVVDSQC